MNDICGITNNFTNMFHLQFTLFMIISYIHITFFGYIANSQLAIFPVGLVASWGVGCMRLIGAYIYVRGNLYVLLFREMTGKYACVSLYFLKTIYVDGK